MTVRVGRINGKNLNYTDYDVSAGESAFLNAGIIEGMEVVSGFVNVGRAMVEVTRTNTVPHQKFLVHVEITAREPVDTTGNKKIWLEVNEQYINDGTLATDPRWVGIARVLSGAAFPAKNFLALAEVVNGQIHKKSVEISSKFLQKELLPNTNLNDIKTPGFYFNGSNLQSETMANLPPTNDEKAFGMMVYAASGIIQEWTNYQVREKWIRRCYADNWSEWKKIFPFSARALDIGSLPEVFNVVSGYNFFPVQEFMGENKKVTLETLRSWIFSMAMQKNFIELGTANNRVHPNYNNGWHGVSAHLPRGGLYSMYSWTNSSSYDGEIGIQHSKDNTNWTDWQKIQPISSSHGYSVSGFIPDGYVRLWWRSSGGNGKIIIQQF